ncbi:MAG: ABC transporter permease [Enterocloster bolteae]
MTLIIITRGIGLSVGSIIALTGCVAAILIVNFKVSWPLAILATLIIGFLVGGFNGLLITKFNVVPFIATLGSMNIIRGIAFIITNGQAIYVPDPVISFMGDWQAVFADSCTRNYYALPVYIILADYQIHGIRKKCICSWGGTA